MRGVVRKVMVWDRVRAVREDILLCWVREKGIQISSGDEGWLVLGNES